MGQALRFQKGNPIFFNNKTNLQCFHSCLERYMFFDTTMPVHTRVTGMTLTIKALCELCLKYISRQWGMAKSSSAPL